MNSKTKLRVDKIIELKHHIENWEIQTSEEIEKLLVDFEKQPSIGGKTKRAIYDQSKTCLELA